MFSLMIQIQCICLSIEYAIDIIYGSKMLLRTQSFFKTGLLHLTYCHTLAPKFAFYFVIPVKNSTPKTYLLSCYC